MALDVSDALSHDLGFDVKVAHNLRNAEKLAQEHAFDYALLDINLGHGERSTELGKALSARGVRVIFASGYNRDELSEVEDFPLVEKPFQLRDLRAVFSDHMPPHAGSTAAPQASAAE